MKKIQVLFFALLICLFAANLYAQEQGKISGKILSTLNIPIEGAVISVTGSEDVTTDKNGVFQIQCKDPHAESQYFCLGCRVLYSVSGGK
jgi:hypothetical protein